MAISPYELPRVRNAELVPANRRIITSLIREGIEHRKSTKPLGTKVNEFVNLPDLSSFASPNTPEFDTLLNLIIEEKNGLNEFVTNCITGMVLWGKWKDSEPAYTASFPYAHLFINQLLQRITKRKAFGVKTEDQASSLLMKELAREYMRTNNISFENNALFNILLVSAPELLPSQIPLYLEPIDVLDLVLARFIAEKQGQLVPPKNRGVDLKKSKQKKGRNKKNTKSPSVVELTVGGYQSWITGKVHLMNDNHTTSQKRLREKMLFHEVIHSLSTGTNGETDPELWQGKSGLKRFSLELDEEENFIEEALSMLIAMT